MSLQYSYKSRPINKILLIFPPSSLEGVGMEDSFVPNGLLSIANYIKQKKLNSEIKVLDGSVVSMQSILEIIEKFCPDLVGLSILLGNYKNAKKILEKAKEVDSLTVVGNHHAKYLNNLLIENPGFIIKYLDFIIEGKRGEYSFYSLINAIENGLDLKKIPSLTYLNHGIIYTNKLRESYPRIEQRISPDLQYIDDNNLYFKAYNKIFSGFHTNKSVRQININYIEGCRQGCSEPCIYCCLKDHTVDFLQPEEYWYRVSELTDKGFNYLFETCNSLSSLQYQPYRHSNYLDHLANSIPECLKGKFQMMVYARADEINEKSLDAFKKIGVQRVIFGFDSGDSTVLKNGIKKANITASDNINAAKMLSDEGIQIYACYVPGSTYETKESLENTYNQILYLLDLKNTCVIEFTSLAPMPGSQAWELICKDYINTYGISDYIEIGKLAQFWIDKRVPNVSWDLIQEHKEKIKSETLLKNKIFGGYY